MSERLDLVLKQIDKKYGENTVIRGSQYPQLPRFSSGVFSLDCEVGGGLPRGRVLIFVGNESTGKTTVACRAAASAQHTCRECGQPLQFTDDEVAFCLGGCVDAEPMRVFYCDIEGAFDPMWFEALGGDNESLYLSQPEFAEQGVDIVEAVIRTGDIDLVVIDSIAMMTPAVEIEKSAEDAIVGNHAKLMNRFMRAIQSGFNSLGVTSTRKPTVILVNQWREKVGVMYGSPETMPGGRGQGYASSVTVKFFARPSDQIAEVGGEGSKKDARIVGQKIRFSVPKNKTFPPHKEGHFDLYTDDSQPMGIRKATIDNAASVLEYAVKYGIVQKSGAWLRYAVEGSEWVVEGQGKEKFLRELDGAPDVLAELARKAMQAYVSGYTKDADETSSETEA